MEATCLGVATSIGAGLVGDRSTLALAGPKDGRAVIGKLGQMCFVFDDTDPSLACANCLLTPEGKTSVSVSALLQAPELEDGCPMGASDHSWTAGLIYAMMRFGYNPTTRIVAGHFDDWTTMATRLAERGTKSHMTKSFPPLGYLARRATM